MYKVIASLLLAGLLAIGPGLASADRAGAIQSSATGPTGASATTAAADGDAFTSGINTLRATLGLGALAADGELNLIAQQWAEQMAAARGIWHNPDLSSQVSAPWTRLGENVGVGYDVLSLLQAFINSAAHYASLIEPAFTHVGVGVAWGPDARMYTTQVFMALGAAPAPAPARPREQASEPQPEPEPEPAPVTEPAPDPEPAGEPAPAVEPVPETEASAEPVHSVAPAEPARVAAVLAALRQVG